MSTQWRFFITFGLVIALALVGVVFRLAPFVVLSIPGFIYSGTLLVSLLLLPAPDITITRRLDQNRFSEGDVVPAKLTFKQREPSLAFIGISERLPLGLNLVEGETTFLGDLSQREETVSYSLEATRGEYELEQVRITAWSRFGMAMRETQSECPVALRCVPKVERLPMIPIRPRRTRAFTGPIKANIGGTGIDFFGGRAYYPGDDVRRINWRAYALRDELVVTEFEQERIADVNLILDARARAHTQVGETCTFDFATQATASLASHFIDQGNNVGLLVYGDYLNWVFPAVGRGQTERILDTLSRAQIADKKAFEDLRQIPTRLFPPRSQLILVSPLVDESDVEILALLRARGYSLMLVCPDSLPLEQAVHVPTTASQLAERMLRMKRAIFLESLAQFGVQIVDWSLDEPLAVAVRQVIRRRGAHS
jgi:uncharacterized protein (DUF58 family)